jgi:hypothetical protein
MPIRSQDDSTSRVAVQEKEYFKKQDKTATSMNFNRFLFMPPGSKDKCFDWRLDWTKKRFESSTFLIVPIEVLIQEWLLALIIMELALERQQPGMEL